MDHVSLMMFFLTLTLTLLLFGWRVARLARAIFLFPIVTYTFINFLIILIFDCAVSRMVKQWKFGYIFKFCTMVVSNRLNLKEVQIIMKGVRFDKPHEYVCKCDIKKSKDERTSFKVRFLTAPEQADIRDAMYAVSGVGNARKERFLTGSSSLLALEKGLLGWENFNYEDSGEKIEFSSENFSCIPPAERDEIANYIRGIEEEAEM